MQFTTTPYFTDQSSARSDIYSYPTNLRTDTISSHDDNTVCSHPCNTNYKHASHMTARLLDLSSKFTQGGDGQEPKMLETAMKYTREHGVGEEYNLKDRDEYEMILDFPIIKAAAFIAYHSGEKGTIDVVETYTVLIRAINALALALDEYIRPDDIFPRSFVFILQKVWDIGIELAGSIRTRARLIGRNHVGLMELNVIHAQHYREYVEQALRDNTDGRICNRALYVITRPELPPFVRPLELLERLKGLKLDVFHEDCTIERCERDFDGLGTLDQSYHAPGCPRDCPRRIPPPESIASFNFILVDRAQMPAVSIYPEKAEGWWVPTTRNTLAVSHVWRDGMGGTRDNGLNQCLHDYFTKLAINKGLDSYWIDSATIPADNDQRRLMIQRINSTFATASLTLCQDARLANAATLGDDGTALLAIVVSFWHRRAWTLLEGHKSNDMSFFRAPSILEPFNVKKAVQNVILNCVYSPLWLLSTIAELEAYLVDGMTPESSGILLSSRRASRESDSELIWCLLAQPFTAAEASTSMNNTPFDFTDKVDVAFISSNAQRSGESGLCWMPGSITVNTWVSSAIGGIKADIVRVTETHLQGNWFAKNGDERYIGMIDWVSPIADEKLAAKLKTKLETGAYDFKILCPILAIRRKRVKSKKVLIVSRVGFSEKAQLLDLTEIVWHWESIVELSMEVEFTGDDIQSLKIGLDEVVQNPDSSGISSVRTPSTFLGLIYG